LGPVDDLGRAVNRPPEQVVCRCILYVIEGKFVLCNDGGWDSVRHEWDEVSLIKAVSPHGVTSAGGVCIRSAVIVQDGTELNAGRDDSVASASGADRNAGPVVPYCLIGIDDNVISLA